MRTTTSFNINRNHSLDDGILRSNPALVDARMGIGGTFPVRLFDGLKDQEHTRHIRCSNHHDYDWTDPAAANLVAVNQQGRARDNS